MTGDNEVRNRGEQGCGQMACPSCDSTEVRKASAVHEQQTHHSTAQTTGVGVGTGGIGVGAASTTGQSQSITAMRLQPPADPLVFQIASLVFGLIALFFAAAVFMSGPASIVAIGLTAWGWFSFKGMKPDYLKAKAAYDRKWYCFRCGHVGDVDEYTATKLAAAAQ